MKDFITLAISEETPQPRSDVTASSAIPSFSHYSWVLSATAGNYLVKQIGIFRAKNEANWSLRAGNIVPTLLRQADELANHKTSVRADGKVDSSNVLDSVMTRLSQVDDRTSMRLISDYLSPGLQIPDPNLLKFISLPTTLATLYSIYRSSLVSPEDQDLVAITYLTFITTEGVPPNASQLGIPSKLYSKYKRLSAANFSIIKPYLPVIIRSFFSSLGFRTPGDSNVFNPSSDTEQYLANAGLLTALYTAVVDNWYTKSIPIKSVTITPQIRDFSSHFSSSLADRTRAIPLLMYYYKCLGVAPYTSVYDARKFYDAFNVFMDKLKDVTSTPGLIPYLRNVSTHRVGFKDLEVTSNEVMDIDTYNAYILQAYNVSAPSRPSGSEVITSGFGKRKQIKGKHMSAYHKGLDLRASIGRPVFAPEDGFIDTYYFKPGMGWGKSITMRAASDGSQLRFAHLSQVLSPKGTAVRKGQVIALTGKTGTTDPHLHFELSLANVGIIDPLKDAQHRWKFLL